MANSIQSSQPWYKKRFPVPPPVQEPYSNENALDDLPPISYALELFLSSHMVESEEFCHQSDKEKKRLYFSTGYGLIQFVKAMMSYEDEDLLAAIAHTKHGNLVASQHRKKATLFGSRIVGYVASSLSSASNSGIINHIKSMTDLERHAELVYAESLFEKALLGIVYSGDWLAFIKEALNMRALITVYKHLGMYIDHMDALAVQVAASSTPPKPGDPPVIDQSIDAHFRSGVYLGVGMSNIILSLMPSRLLTIVELFGYKGDRKLGLDTLMRAGGWSKDSNEPSVGVEKEGVRRALCDMCLLIFHLVLSSFTFDGVDLSMAAIILQWNLRRYPNGVFFLFGAGRLALCRSQPALAIDYYTRAMESQSQYRNLHHISFWEIAIAKLALWEVKEAATFWRDLVKEATWSKSIYTYGLAVCLLELGNSSDQKEVVELMEQVPNLRQKIAGKSIPLEKFVARKARKYQIQNKSLALPALELAYLFQAIAHAPRKILAKKMLPEVWDTLAKLGWDACGYEESTPRNKDIYAATEARENSAAPKILTTPLSEKERKKIEKEWNSGKGGYWDDYCLARFLEGVCLRYVAYPDTDAVLESEDSATETSQTMPKKVAEEGASKAFAQVFEAGPKIELDHHLVYHAHYELGRLLVCQGKVDEASVQLELVLSGKPLEVGQSGKKGKYSMENALHMRTHAAVEALHQKRL